jgi:hypothetical protein
MSTEIWASPSLWTRLYIWEVPLSLEQNFVDLHYILKFYMKENEEVFKLRNYGSDYKPRWGNFYSEGPNSEELTAAS